MVRKEVTVLSEGILLSSSTLRTSLCLILSCNRVLCMILSPELALTTCHREQNTLLKRLMVMAGAREKVELVAPSLVRIS